MSRGRNRFFSGSHELLFKRFGGGIKLFNPDLDEAQSHHSMQDILQIPVDVCVMDQRHCSQLLNSSAIQRSGFDSLKPCLNKTVFEVANLQTAETVTQQHLISKNQNKMHMMEYDFIRKDEWIVQSILFSYPLYDEENKFIGIMDLSINSNTHSITDSISHMMKFGLLNQSLPASPSIIFSKREKQCIRLVAQGKTAKEIGLILSLSSRTVEHYLENAMNKSGMTNRRELILNYAEVV